MIAVLLAIVAAAMLLVRLGWGGTGGWRIAGAGWTVAGAALVALTIRDGAWGFAIGTVAGTAAALGAVLYAGWRSPAKSWRPPRVAPSIAIPRRWPDLARRIAVFALVVPVAFAAAQWLAYAVQAVARRGGWGDADAIVLTLFLQPIAWGVLMTIQMTRADAARMIVPPVATAALATILWSAS